MNVHGVLPHQAPRFSTERIISWLAVLWSARPLSSPFRALLFALALILIAVIRVVTAGFPQNAYPHDMFIFLDGAWRVINGQRPQVDFNSNLGPLVYLFTAAGFLLTHHAAHAIAVAQTFFAVIVGSLTAWVSFRRMSQVPAMLVTAAAFLIALSPCNTGEEPFSITYAMLYNRTGFGLLAFILVEATQPPRITRTEREELIGGFLSGFVIAFLFFLKFTYAFIALALIAGLLPYRAQMRRRFVGMAAGIIAVSLLIFAYLGFHIGTVLTSLILGAEGKHLALQDMMLHSIAYLQTILLLIVIAALSAWVSVNIEDHSERRNALLRAWAVALVSFSALALLLSNAQREGLPLAALMCFIVANEMIAASPGNTSRLSQAASIESPSRSIAFCLVFFALLLPVANVLFWDTGAFLFSVARASGIHGGDEGRLNSPVASDFKSRQKFLDNDLQLQLYSEYVSEGVALLRSNSSPSDSIVTLDFVNPFPFLLQRRPATGGTTCLHYNTTFDEKHHLSPDELLGDATLVMWPKSFEEPRLGSGIECVYGEAVKERFTPVAENRMWRLLRRKQSPNLAANK